MTSWFLQSFGEQKRRALSHSSSLCSKAIDEHAGSTPDDIPWLQRPPPTQASWDGHDQTLRLCAGLPTVEVGRLVKRTLCSVPGCPTSLGQHVLWNLPQGTADK